MWIEWKAQTSLPSVTARIEDSLWRGDAVAAGVSRARLAVAARVSRAGFLRIAADTAASTVKQMVKDRPHRLDLIYFRSPLFFVTFCTRNRTEIPSLDLAQRAIENYAQLGILNFDVATGRYVIMPDHVHLFVRGDHGFVLSTWVGGLKRAMSVAVVKQRLWQPGFFDHVLRSSESYAEKWNYVRENPVRAGLVDYAANWPYQGEIVVIDRA